MKRTMGIVVVLAGCGGGKDEFVAEEFANDPMLLEWNEGDSYGRVWVGSSTVEPVTDETCELGAEFVVATARGSRPRGKVARECALYSTLDAPGDLRHAGAGYLSFQVGSVTTNVTVTPEPQPAERQLDCAVDLDLIDTIDAQTAAAEEPTDEVPEFRVTMTRPDPLEIVTPGRSFPDNLYGDGDLAVEWTGGEIGTGVEITVRPQPADDTGQGVIRCWTKDDGAHAIPASLVDPFREGVSIVTVSRITTEPPEIEGWDIRPYWAESTWADVVPF